jgi:hypothetical protein
MNSTGILWTLVFFGLFIGTVEGWCGENYRIYPSSFSQTEPFIVRHPFNPDTLFISANTINLGTGFISEGIYVTTDLGHSWFVRTDTCNGAMISSHGGDPGIAIDKNGTFLLIRLGFSPGLYSHNSNNLGVTWGGQRTVATNDQDRATLTTDAEPSSQNYGRSYAGWVRFAPPYPVFFSYTDNGGNTWSTPAQINNPPARGQGGEMAMGPNGEVCIAWAGVTNVSPFTEDFVGFAISTNGGAAWTVRENAFDMNGIAGTFPQKGNIRVNGLPRIDVDATGGVRDGWIYVVTTQRNLAPAGSDPDIIFNRSTDRGTTWSAGIRVNQDAMNNGKFQYFPAIHVDGAGGINVLYYDDRNTSADSSGVYLSRSVDGGTTWRDFRISDHNFKPQPIAGFGQGYQGDNISLVSAHDTLFPVWMDNSAGIYQLWTSPTALSELTDVKENSSEFPTTIQLHQNFPNPFNPSCQIEYTLPAGGFVKLVVYDIYGREVKTLVNEEQQVGTHRIVFDTRSLSLASGLYLYRLTSNGTTSTRKMVLLK